MQHSASSLGAASRVPGTPPTRHPSSQRRGSSRQLIARSTCRAEQHGQGGRPGSAPPPPPPRLPLPRVQAVDRRGLLALLAAANLVLPAPQATAAPAPRPVQPLPVPPLTETFTSPEGFAFDYPGDGSWVVAFDRSGSTGNGAVVVVGDFRKLVTVSAFRTETVPEAVRQAGLTEESGYDVLVEPQRTERGTMRFNLLRSELGPGGAYEYEFSIESCAGEVEEGLGGKLRCLNAFGGAIPTAPRRVVGRSVLVNGTAYSLTASSPEERWEEVGPLLRAVVATFRK